MIKRTFDILIALTALTFLIIPFILIWIIVKFTSSGPGIYWSRRIGRNDVFFMMPKFRTMRINTPEVATNKLTCVKKYLTPIGSFLRQSSLDETPQFISVLFGDMSVVGPRPALHNEHDLIVKRNELGINILKPGITGWAQVNGRDNLELKDKIFLDEQYLKNQSLILDIKILIKTIINIINSKNIIH